MDKSSSEHVVIFCSRGKFCILRDDKHLEVLSTAEEVINYIDQQKQLTFRVAPSPELGNVITTLYNKWISGEIERPWIHKCLDLDFLSFSEEGLRALYEYIFEQNIPISLGGPRGLTFDDFCYGQTWMMVQSMPEAFFLPLVGKHSFLPLTKFFTIPNEEYLARLICLIGDPRWYLNADSKNELSDLYFLLGLKWKNFILILSRPREHSLERYSLFSWFDSHLAFEALNNIHTYGTEKLSDGIVGLRPGDVFYRMLYNEIHSRTLDYTSDKRYSFSRCVYSTSKKFIMMLTKIWLAFLNLGRSSESLFVADYELPLEKEEFKRFYSVFGL